MTIDRHGFAGTKPASAPSAETLLDRFLRHDEELTSVERFAKRHEQGEVPLFTRYYKELMPTSPPGPGQQYAFEVDLDRCTACKACVVACHNLNGLEETEVWRNTGLLVGGTKQEPFQQTVTATCHHCVDPACLNGCPVNAYEKDPVTGIVKHLDDQCIGCKYCTLTCPYDVPTFSESKGIVRKCDMCSDRLSEGEAPACVQACPNEAILVRIVDVAEVVERSEAGNFLPGAPSPDITIPTTSYVSRNALPQNLLPADYYSVKKEAPELPLVFMLVLSQLSVGAFVWDALLRVTDTRATARPGDALCLSAAVAIGWLALLASMWHLGRPRYAFRALLGLRHSWLSREILTLGLYVIFATLHVLAPLAGPKASPYSRPLFVAAVVMGCLGVFCSIKVYTVTRRDMWRASLTGFKFVTTMLLLGAMTALVGQLYAIGGTALVSSSGHGLRHALMLLAAAKLAQELSVLAHITDTLHSSIRRAATLMMGPLRTAMTTRVMVCALGGLAIPRVLPWFDDAGVVLGVALVGFACLIVGEILERYLFFTTGVAMRMPGGHSA